MRNAAGWRAILTATALLAPATLASALDLDAAVEQLAAPDAVDREAAERLLVEAGDDATGVLDRAAQDPRPAVRQAAWRLRSRIHAGLAEMPQSVADELARDAIAVVDVEARDVSNELRRLLRRPIVAAPAIARALEQNLPRQTPRQKRAIAAFLDQTGPLHAEQPGPAWLDREDRPALVAAVASRPSGAALLATWLEAAETSGQPVAGAREAADLDSAAWRWVRGEVDDVPALLDALDPADRQIAQVARNLLLGRAVAADDLGEADDLVRAGVLRAAVLAGDDAALNDEAATTLLAAATEASSAMGLAAAGRPAEALAAAGDDDPLTRLGLLWVGGDLVGFRDYQPDAGGEAAREAVFRARAGITRELLDGRNFAETPEVEAYEHGRVQLAVATLDGDAGATLERLRALARVDGREAGWRFALADRGEVDVTIARLAPLDDAQARLDAARHRLAFAPDAAAREAALVDVRDAAVWALLDRPTLAPGNCVTTIRRCASLAEEAGAVDLAVRLNAAALALLFRSDVRAALAERATAWPPMAGAAQAQGTLGDLHRVRLMAAQHAGDDAAAEREYTAAMAVQPLDVGATIARVRHLDAQERREEAGRTFNATFVPLQALIAQFEQSPMLHNQASWLAARSRRRPDTAGRLATTAVAFRPSEATYLDTLAETHAADGDVATAEQQMRQVLLYADGWEFPLFVMRLAQIRAGG